MCFRIAAIAQLFRLCCQVKAGAKTMCFLAMPSRLWVETDQATNAVM